MSGITFLHTPAAQQSPWLSVHRPSLFITHTIHYSTHFYFLFWPPRLLEWIPLLPYTSCWNHSFPSLPWASVLNRKDVCFEFFCQNTSGITFLHTPASHWLSVHRLSLLITKHTILFNTLLFPFLTAVTFEVDSATALYILLKPPISRPSMCNCFE